MIEEGIYDTLSSEDYHGDRESYSRSTLMTFNQSPFHYWAKYLNPETPVKKTSKEMYLGSAFHTLILEPHLFDKLYIVEPEKVLLKDVGRCRYDIYKAQIELCEKSEKTVLTMEEYQTLLAMEKSLKSNHNYHLITDAIYERSYFWHDKDSGLLLKSRPDILHDNLYVDLKTSTDISPRAFQMEMVKYGYHIQCAMLKNAVKELENKVIETCVNLCIETKYPYPVALRIIDQAAIDKGEEQYKDICLRLKSCLEINAWPGYETATIGLPTWAN